MSLLVNLNAATAEHVMCRFLLGVGWDRAIYDGGLNQMFDLSVPGATRSTCDVEVSELTGSSISTGEHCFRCTAGTGSNRGGSLA